MRQRTPLQRRTRLENKKPMRKANPERLARRRAKYEAAIRSPHWRELRKRAFARAGGVCECPDRCGRPLGKGWTLDHVHYQRLGQERLDDVRALSAPCNRRLEYEKRGWYRGSPARRRGGAR